MYSASNVVSLDKKETNKMEFYVFEFCYISVSSRLILSAVYAGEQVMTLPDTPLREENPVIICEISLDTNSQAGSIVRYLSCNCTALVSRTEYSINPCS